jgi:hypothetical protein
MQPPRFNQLGPDFDLINTGGIICNAVSGFSWFTAESAMVRSPFSRRPLNPDRCRRRKIRLMRRASAQTAIIGQRIAGQNFSVS